MNKGLIQAERAASAQRDLFDTQIRIEDQLIEQKSEPRHPGSAKPERVVLTAEKRGGGSSVEYCHPDSAAKNARFYRGRGYTVKTWTVEEYHQHLEQHGPTIRTLTDTFNAKL